MILLKFSFLIFFLTYIFCFESLASEPESQVFFQPQAVLKEPMLCECSDHYKHGITPLEGSVRRIPFLRIDEDNLDYIEVHNNLRNAVLHSAREYFLKNERAKDLFEKAKRSSKGKSEDKEDKEGKEDSFPNFSAAALTFVYKDGQAVKKYDIYICGKHLDRA